VAERCLTLSFGVTVLSGLAGPRVRAVQARRAGGRWRTLRFAGRERAFVVAVKGTGGPAALPARGVYADGRAAVLAPPRP
jgi:hypothetical protein